MGLRRARRRAVKLAARARRARPAALHYRAPRRQACCPVGQAPHSPARAPHRRARPPASRHDAACWMLRWLDLLRRASALTSVRCAAALPLCPTRAPRCRARPPARSAPAASVTPATSCQCHAPPCCPHARGPHRAVVRLCHELQECHPRMRKIGEIVRTQCTGRRKG